VAAAAAGQPSQGQPLIVRCAAGIFTVAILALAHNLYYID
jgi:hypothetical protein